MALFYAEPCARCSDLLARECEEHLSWVSDTLLCNRDELRLSDATLPDTWAAELGSNPSKSSPSYRTTAVPSVSDQREVTQKRGG